MCVVCRVLFSDLVRLGPARPPLFFSYISSGSDLTRLFVDSTQVALSEPAFFCLEFYAPEERKHELASVLVLQ